MGCHPPIIAIMGTLYIVATPIGNLDDISIRAAHILREISVVAAEDTRVARKLLNHLGASPKLLSHHEHSRKSSTARVLEALESGDVALVTDAGTPAISDPGPVLVRGAVERGHAVIPIPGPSAVTAALSISGMAADRFAFVGFLPRKAGDREKELAAARDRETVTVCFEAPHRVLETLSDIDRLIGDREITVCREITKLYEETFRGVASEAIERFSNPRGEFVIVIAPGDRFEGVDNSDLDAAIDRLRGGELTGRDLVDAVVQATGAPRSRVYRRELDTREG